MASELHENRTPMGGAALTEGREPPGSLMALLAPLATSILILTLFFFFMGGDVALEIFTTALVTATIAGKFIVVRGLAQQGFFDSPFKLVPLIVYLDLAVALVAVYNMGFLYRLPRLGAKLESLQAAGCRILSRNPWMRKVTFLGIVGFVMFPISGTGAIGGAFFGRLLGLSRRRTMIGIAIGSILGGAGMAFLAGVSGDALKKLQGSPVLLVGGVLAVGGILYWLMRRAKALAAED